MSEDVVELRIEMKHCKEKECVIVSVFHVIEREKIILTTREIKAKSLLAPEVKKYFTEEMKEEIMISAYMQLRELYGFTKDTN